LLQGRVGLRADQVGQPVEVVGSEGRWRPAAVRLGVDRAGGAAAPEQSDDEGGADAEDPGDPADRAIVSIESGQDPFAKVQRIGAHGENLLLRRRMPRSPPDPNYSRVQPEGKPL
jgi:hypothetical protein